MTADLIVSFKLSNEQKEEQTRLLYNPECSIIRPCEAFVVRDKHAYSCTEKRNALDVKVVHTAQDLLKCMFESVLVSDGRVVATNVESSTSIAFQMGENERKAREFGFMFRYNGYEYCFLQEIHHVLYAVAIYKALPDLSEYDALCLLNRLAARHPANLVLLDFRGLLMRGRASYIQKGRSVPVVLNPHGMRVYADVTAMKKHESVRFCTNTAAFIREHHLEEEYKEYLEILDIATNREEFCKRMHAFKCE